MRKVIGKEEAIKSGLTRYFTGHPCRRGHLAERTTSSGSCVECDRVRASGLVKTIMVQANHVEYITALMDACMHVSPAQIARCQSDADHNLWIDGLWIGRWNTRGDLVRYMWGWLIEHSTQAGT